jgi:hypothetical protein
VKFIFLDNDIWHCILSVGSWSVLYSISGVDDIFFKLCREAVLAREREEDERWRQRMLDKFAEDDRIGIVTYMQYTRSTFAAHMQNRARICKQLWSSGIDSEKSIPLAHVVWRAGTKNRVVVLARQTEN